MQTEKYHFIGLGGIGMSALARILLERGAHVQGSDLQSSALLEALRRDGAKVSIGHTKEALEGATVAIYSSDIRSDNIEWLRAKELNLSILHRSELLHALMTDKKPLLVTGTHGKTSVTALLASTLDGAGLAPSFVVGGIHLGWNTNSRSQKGEFFVAEADESDGSFLKTPAFGGIVTNLDNDHLNYWKTAAQLEEAFQLFFTQASSDNHLFWCGDDPRLSALTTKGISYGFGHQNQLRITSFEPTENGIRFSIEWGTKKYNEIELRLFGRHNALNGAAVFGLALQLGASEEAIRKAFSTFAGTGRRLEWKGKVNGVDLYDDYGHHPTEIGVTLKALRDKIRERRLVVIFQPHRYTRVEELMDEFGPCFNEADLLIMTDIYSAGESSIAGVSSEILYAKLQQKMGDRVLFFPRAGLETSVAHLLRPYDTALTIGAGDVTKAGGEILRHYERQERKWTVGVLFGGTSSEYAVSLMSAKTILDGLKETSFLQVKPFGLTKSGQWLIGSPETLTMASLEPFTLSGEVLSQLQQCDVIIPVFHGQQGEDGMIQGLLDTLHIPYVGCDYRSSALCMQKVWTKHIARSIGVPTAPFVECDAITYRKNPELLAQKIEEELHYPIWVKAVHLGSSLGVYRVEEPSKLAEAVQAVFALDDTLIAEQEIVGREVEFSLLGNEYIRVAPPGEIKKMDPFHQYDHKYGVGASPIEIPAKISGTERAVAEALACQMYMHAGCKGLARIDFFLDKGGHFWFNEINPFPGFTATSAYPAMWEVFGLNISALCDELLILAFHKYRRLRTIRGK
jgi:UDP-N-acetylmuramate--alanine ligase